MYVCVFRCCSTNIGDPFVYSRAIVCGGVASTLPTTSLRLATSKQKVDLEVARQQQKKYVEVAKNTSMQYMQWKTQYSKHLS